MIILYNPKTYNNMPSARVTDIWRGTTVVINVNEMKKFSDDNLAMYLKKKYGFLQEVEVDQVIRVQGEIEKPEPKEVEEIKERKLKNLNPKQLEALNAVPSGDSTDPATVSALPPQKMQTPEESAGIPAGDGTKDADGVTWVGDGLEEDKPEPFMAPRRPGKSKGVFGAA